MPDANFVCCEDPIAKGDPFLQSSSSMKGFAIVSQGSKAPKVELFEFLQVKCFQMFLSDPSRFLTGDWEELFQIGILFRSEIGRDFSDQ